MRTAAMTARSTCGMCSSTSSIVTTSKESAGKGCSHTSRRSARNCGKPPSARSLRKSILFSSKSRAVTLTQGNSRMKGMRKTPRPLPTSSMLSKLSERKNPMVRLTRGSVLVERLKG